MPELPEVETVRRSLERLVVGKTIRDVDVFVEKMIRNMDENRLKEIITNQVINGIKRRGKYLLFDVGDYYIVSHLRMEGRYFIKHLDEPKDKHEHVIFYFTDGVTMRYHDTRKFGTFDIVKKNEMDQFKPLVTLGYEPLEDQLTVKYLKEKLRHKTIAIKSALLDQHIVAGLGNIYVNEVLFLSKVHPEKPSNTLKKKELERIVKYSKEVLELAIKDGGTTIRSYTSSLGVTGRFQQHLKVHMQNTCPVCGKDIQKIRVGGRGTYLCDHCQKMS